MLSLVDVTSMTLPASVAARTHAHLAAAGRNGLEGMALWAGVFNGSHFLVTEAIIPEQQGTRSPDGLLVTVAGMELHRINMHLFRAGLRLVAQVHSHPGKAYHSDTDDQYAIATALGSISVVVPDFAKRPFEIASCAIYRLRARSRWLPGRTAKWAQLTPVEVATLIRLEG